MNKPLTTVSNITTGKLDSNAAKENGAYPFFTCAPEPLSIDKFSFDDDVILLAGNNAQGDFHINRYCGKFDAYQRTYVITAKEGYDIDYVYYSLELALRHLKRIAQGSQTKFLTMQILDGFMIEDIPFDSQTNLIASIKAIDAKIALNKRINAELEAMAKTIYDYWFVQFDFPDKSGKPYRTSGGAMEWNEQLNREIPKGWKVGRFCDAANIVMGQSPSGDSYNEQGTGMVFFQGSTDFGTDYPSTRVYTTAPSRIAQQGDILLSVRAPVGTMNTAFEKCCIGRGLAAINSKIGANTYLKCLVAGLKTHFDIFNGNGTTFGSLTKDTLYEIVTIMPPDDLVLSFEKALPANSEIRLNNEKQTRELTRLRDWLLPMLMNGQATVSAEDNIADD